MISFKELEDDDEKKLEWREVHFDNKNDSNFIYINRDGNDSNNNSSSNNNIITTFDTTMYNASNYQDAQNTYPYSSQEVELVEPGQLSLSQLLHLFCNQEIFNMEDDEMFNTGDYLYGTIFNTSSSQVSDCEIDPNTFLRQYFNNQHGN
nr:15406_t:CDS:1 [Entrophospora candida]